MLLKASPVLPATVAHVVTTVETAVQALLVPVVVIVAAAHKAVGAMVAVRQLRPPHLPRHKLLPF